MPLFTIFYSHPAHLREGGRYEVIRSSAAIAGKEAVDMLPDDLSPDEDPELLDIESIRDDLVIAVYDGRHTIRPDGPPAWEFR